MPPTQRHTSSRRDRRRSQLKLAAPALAACPKCKAPALSHRACLNCGTYRGRMVIDVLAKLTKRERKAKERELAAQKAQKQEGQAGAPLSVEELSRK